MAINEPDECPLCHFAVKPIKIHMHPYWIEQQKYVAALYECSHCHQVFCSLSLLNSKTISLNNIVLTASDLLYVGPTRYAEQKFDPAIEKISSQFVKIFNQALAAESSGLDEIAGIGYRKAL